MQNTLQKLLKTMHTEHKGSSPTFTLIWVKSKSKSHPTWTALRTSMVGIFIIAFAFFDSNALLKELIASGLLIGMSGLLQWSERPRLRPFTAYCKDNLN